MSRDAFSSPNLLVELSTHYCISVIWQHIIICCVQPTCDVETYLDKRGPAEEETEEVSHDVVTDNHGCGVEQPGGGDVTCVSDSLNSNCFLSCMYCFTQNIYSKTHISLFFMH